MQSFNPLLERGTLIGVLHLPPLPGSPRPGPGFDAVLSHALRDAEVLAEGGARGVIVENLGDAPYPKDACEPHVIAMLAVIARQVRERFGDQLVVGVNALRNDAIGSLGAVAASGGAFVRVNVLTGVMVTDQGLIEGRAREVLNYRRSAAPEAAIVADVLVKHASPLGPVDLAQTARDTFRRAGASVLVATGSGTGQPTDLGRVRAIRDAVPEATIWVGSGVTGDTARSVGRQADGAIVGTWLHQGGDVRAPLELARVRRVAQELAG